VTSLRPDFWVPRTAAELEAALADDVWAEDHFHDFKRELAAGHNTRLAIDLASFAVDGGLIFIGVAEDKTDRTLSAYPILLAGLPERITEIGLTAVVPPLLVTATALPLVDDGTRGYAVVRVPRSPNAPHQVDEIYRGRGDVTNRRLADPEVRRVLDERSFGRVRIGELLDAAIAGDPTPRDARQQSHLFIVANPIPPMPFGLVDALRTNPAGTVRRWVVDEGLIPGQYGSWSQLQTPRRRAGCWGISRRDLLDASRNVIEPARTSDVLDVEICEDGGIRLFAAHGTVDHVGGRFVPEPLIAEYTMRIVDLAGRISREVPYFGGWQIGISLTNLDGARASTIYQRTGFPYDAPIYGGSSYRMTTEASAEEVFSAYREVAERLVGRLMRDLNFGRDLELPNLPRR
jgi:hypothetical protein